MKKLYASIICTLLFAHLLHAQLGTWTWVKGDSSKNIKSVYGQKGISSAANKPGSRVRSFTWTDVAGNFYLYGGEEHHPTLDSTLKLNDLWKYNIKTNEWTWLNGDSVPGKSAVYGVQGLASASNSPGSRQWGSSWTDAIGNFWLFGGRTQNDYYYRNDLWKYDVRLNQLIWIKGDSVPGAASIYGTQGLAMAANKPGGRAKGITWADTLGNLWLFGGVATGGGMNDLWKYTIATNNWTWVTGDTISAALPVYGTKKVANIANRPGGRQLACSWIDKYGKLWLFGGNVHYRYNDITDLNDLWKFDPSTTEWTWMSGDTTKNPWGVYGVKGIGQPQNKPGGRSFGNNWIDNTGNFWLSGGDGLGSHFSAGLLNDVWKYMPLVDRWIWMSGDSLANSPSNFGALGVAAFTNDPGGRRDAMQWTDQTGNFWLFGGYSTYKAYNNDLWKYIPIVNPNLLVFSVFADQNRDGLKQPSEPFFHNASALIVKQSTGFSTNISSSTGTFAFPVDSGTYTIRPALPSSSYNLVPTLHTSNFAGSFSTDTFSFAAQPIAAQRDLAINIIPATPVRPGMNASYTIFYENRGTDTINSGYVKFVKDSKESFSSATPSPTLMIMDTLIWNFANMYPLNTATISLTLTVAAPPLINVGEQLCHLADIFPKQPEIYLRNNSTNLCQTVTGPVDPNEKTEIHNGKLTVSQLADSEYMQYTIRFQNTGTDTAFNVYIKDTLDNQLDWLSFRMVNSSHKFQLITNDGNKCAWTFSNINLVDSNNNEPLSHGYVTFIIKAKPSLHIGDIIRNSASIYFDYSLPSITNVQKTTIVNDVWPLKLTVFTAKRNANVNILNWTTANETNVDHFDIERSENGKEFSSIGNVKAGGNNYTYTDNHPTNQQTTSIPIAIGTKPQTIYYRLKMLDKDGQFTYSPIRMINNSGTFSINIYPNPAKDNLQIQIDSDRKTVLQLLVLSIDGKVILSNSVDAKEGSILRSINISALPKGSYFLKVFSLDPPSADREVEAQVVKFEKQ